MTRFLWRDPFWDGRRKSLIIAMVGAALMVIFLFLGNLSYLYGIAFKDNSRIHNLNVLAIDYDGGDIGQSLSATYKEFQADSFPTLQFHDASEYPSIADVEKAVCKAHFWAAVIVQEGASVRLSAALSGGVAASSYNASNTLTYVWNEVHYPTAQEGFIEANLETLIGATAATYNSIFGSKSVAAVNSSDPAAVFALLNPIQASNINILPTPQGDRVFYTTVTIILPIMQQFFFLMALNGISNQFGIFGRLRNTRVGIIRMVVSITYTLVASLTVVGYVWAFRETWDVNGTQFVLSWMVMWLYMHINFLVLDAATAFIPLSFISFFVLTWAIINISSAVFPFEVSPGFYKWGYALPAHNAVSIFFQIWSGGCNDQLDRALPVLFAWEIVGMPVAVAGSFWRNKIAKKEIQAEEHKEELREERKEEHKKENMGSASTIGSTDDSENGSAVRGMPGLPLPFAKYIYSDKLTRHTTA
jgi:Protein of unknown function (DUF3533)